MGMSGFAMRWLSAGFGLVLLVAAVPTAALGQVDIEMRDKINAGTVRIVSGGMDGTAFRVAADLAAVLDDGDDLRILPIMGKGSVQNLTDILYLKGIDVGIVHLDVLNHLREEKTYRGLERRIRYITKLYNEEFHLLVGEGIESVADLNGKKVNYGVPGSGAYITAVEVFKTLNVEPEPVSTDAAMAVEKIRSGEIAGMVYVAGKPAPLFQTLEAPDGLKLLPIPYTPELLETYVPARLTNEDYPQLIPAEGDVSTLTVEVAMVVFNWKSDTERHKNVSRFVDAFFDHFAEFKRPPRHAKWSEVSLTAKIPGWTRFDAAESWLERNSPENKRLFSESEVEAAFKRFLEQETNASGSQTDQLFQKFLQMLEEQPS